MLDIFADSQRDSATCERYFEVTDEGRQTTVCGQSTRLSTVYTSIYNKISVVAPKEAQDDVKFVLQYTGNEIRNILTFDDFILNKIGLQLSEPECFQQTPNARRKHY